MATNGNGSTAGTVEAVDPSDEPHEGLLGKLGDAADLTKRTLRTADRTLAKQMQENPLLVLGVAVGVGYVIGRLFSRFR